MKLHSFVGDIEHHDRTNHKLLNVKDKDYAFSFKKPNIAKFHSLLHHLGSDPKANINTIVEKASELLETRCSLYSRLEDQDRLLCTRAACNLPPGFDRAKIPDGHICFEETINATDKPVAIEDIEKTSYAETDLNFTKCGLKSYLGFPITSKNGTIGSLCVMDDKIRPFGAEELQIIAILAKALSLEEARLSENRKLEARLRKHRDQLKKLVKQHNTTLSRTNKKLRLEKEDHKRTLTLLEEKEKELSHKNIELEKINLALTVLSKKKAEEINELEESLLCNVRKLVDPVIDKLKNSGLNRVQKKWMSALESVLNEITSPLSKCLSSLHYMLTPSEIKVAGYIKLDKTNKEIAELLGISCRTVEVHRSNLRKKMGIKNRKVNLRIQLLSLE
jgi:DNA-binding CsgD family transcriptional regulator/signal transduction protein with GAF and PtsI domain